MKLLWNKSRGVPSWWISWHSDLIVFRWLFAEAYSAIPSQWLFLKTCLHLIYVFMVTYIISSCDGNWCQCCRRQGCSSGSISRKTCLNLSLSLGRAKILGFWVWKREHTLQVTGGDQELDPDNPNPLWSREVMDLINLGSCKRVILWSAVQEPAQDQDQEIFQGDEWWAKCWCWYWTNRNHHNIHTHTTSSDSRDPGSHAREPGGTQMVQISPKPPSSR